LQLNENIKLLPESSVSVKKRVADFLIENPSATLIRLDQNLMNMPLPPRVTEGMKEAVEEVSQPFGVRLASPWSGYESLKRAISSHLQTFSVKVPESDIFITSGLESAYACLSQLFGAENNVLLPDPCQRSLLDLNQCAGRNIGFVRFTPENHFLPEPEGAAADLIYLASPSPITGAALTREVLKKWVDYAVQNGSILFYDASLSEYIESDEYPRSIYEIEGAKECAIELFSFETGYGVRELKIAYVIIPATLSRNTTRIQQLWCARQPATATPPGYVMQRAAELLFSEEAKAGTEKIIYRIKKVAKILSDGLSRAGIAHIGGETSPYLWVQCPEDGSAWQCFDRLLEEAGCVVTPGSVFGYGGEHFFRLTSFGIPEEAKSAADLFCRVFGKKEASTPDPEAVASELLKDPEQKEVL